MRGAAVLLMLVGVVAAAAVGADPAPAQVPAPAPAPFPSAPPDPTKLKADVAALTKAREDAARDAASTAAAAERAVLKARLMDMLKRLEERSAAPLPKATIPSAKKKFDLPEGTRPLDTLRLAENLFRDGDVDAALRAFRLIDPAALAREDRAFVQYMTACCLRKLNRRGDAAVIYREVAEAKEDEFIAECAVWQLSLIRSAQEFEAQLEQLRKSAQSR